MKKGRKCDYKYCILTKIQARSANLESGPLQIEIGTSTPSVKLQILAEDKKIPKVTTVRFVLTVEPQMTCLGKT